MNGGKKDTEEKQVKKTSENIVEDFEKEPNTEEQVFLYWQ